MDEKSFVRRLTEVCDKIYNSEENKNVREEMGRFKKRFEGEWWSKDDKESGKPTLYANFAFSTVMTVVPLLTDNKPIWSARARRIYMQDYIDGYRRAGEYLWDREDMDMKLLETCLNATIMKNGLVKVYYDPDKDFGGDITMDVIDPRTFFCAPGYTDIWDAPMMGTIERKPLSWFRNTFPKTGKRVKADDESPNIQERDQEDWELHTKTATLYTVWFKDSTTETYFMDEEGKEVDKEEGQKAEREKYPYGRIVYASKQVLLGDKKCEYKHGKPPYVMLYDYKVPHEFWGKGEVDEIEELNMAFNERLSQLQVWTRYYCDPPWLGDSNAGFDHDKMKEELKKGGGYFAVNMSMNPEPLKKVEAPALPQAIPQMMTALSKTIEEISGVTDISKGMTTKQQEQSATEISTLIESSYTRTRQRIRNLEHFLKRCYYLILSLMQQYYTEPRQYSYKAEDLSGDEVWDTIGNSKNQAARTISPRQGKPPSAEEMDVNPKAQEEYLRQEQYYEQFIQEYGEVDEVYAAFDIEIQTNSTLPMDKQSLANLFLRLLQMAGNNPVTGMPMWKAALENLRIPRWKEIVEEMDKLFQQSQAKPPEGGQVPELPSPLQAIGGMS